MSEITSTPASERSGAAPAFGIVGLGRIGGSLARQSVERGLRVVGFNRSPEKTAAFAHEGLEPAVSLDELASRLRPPRVVLIFVPHGDPTEAMVTQLSAHLDPGDIIADGGNSHWKDAQRRYERLCERGIRFLDVGTSGGIAGARRGACFMVGGDAEAFDAIEPILRTLAVPGGVLHAGPSGAGHFVKLVHNAIEFGMLQAIGEGLDLLARSDFDLDLPAVFDNWSHGSVIRGWLVELMTQQLREQRLEDLSGHVEDTREVRWMIEYALEKEAWIPVIAQAEMALYRYRNPDSTAGKGVALMRHGFGGHPLRQRSDDTRHDL